MPNPQFVASSFNELHDFFETFPLKKYVWLYRGQADVSWKLKPKIGREEYNIGGMGLGRFRAWKNKAIAYINLPENEWEQLAIAQHYGLATLLLDWTENPLVAAFFAAYECPDKDGIVYIHSPGKILNNSVIKSPTYFKNPTILNEFRDENGVIPSSLAYYPNAIDKRIINQKGVFTIHHNPQEELESTKVFNPHIDKNLLSIKIKAKAKKRIIHTLQKYGIDYQFLFSDLSGLSEFINFETRQIKEGRV